MTEAMTELLTRETYASQEWRRRTEEHADSEVLDKEKKIPRLITLGGDHSIALAALRALNNIYGQVAVLHFDARTSHARHVPNPVMT